MLFSLTGAAGAAIGPTGAIDAGFTTYQGLRSQCASQTVFSISFCSEVQRISNGGPAAVAIFAIGALLYFIASVSDLCFCCNNPPPHRDNPQERPYPGCELMRLFGFLAVFISMIVSLVLTRAITDSFAAQFPGSNPLVTFGPGGILTVLAFLTILVGRAVECCKFCSGRAGPPLPPRPPRPAQELPKAAAVTQQYPAILEWATRAALPPVPPAMPLPPPTPTLAEAPTAPCPYW